MTGPLPEPIGPTAHGVVDYGFVSLLLTAPTVLGLNDTARRLGVLFAGLQGTVNALTDTPVGVKPLMSLRTHGWLELASGPLFLGLPVALGAVKEPKARTAWLVAFGMLAVTYVLTDWKPGEDE